MAEVTADPAGAYPEHDKLAAVKEQSQTIGAFLDATGIRRYEHEEKADVCPSCDEPVPGMAWDGRTIEQLLANYFGIDLQKLAEEKDAMFQELRARAAARDGTPHPA